MTARPALGCGETVNLDLKWPDRMSKSIDHRQPISKGGAHSLDNCQLMHLTCNISKGARIEAFVPVETE